MKSNIILDTLGSKETIIETPNKKLIEQAAEFATLLGQFKLIDFLGMARILGVDGKKLTGKKVNEGEIISEEETASEFQSIFNEMIDKFVGLNREEKRKLLKQMAAVAKENRQDKKKTRGLRAKGSFIDEVANIAFADIEEIKEAEENSIELKD